MSEKSKILQNVMLAQRRKSIYLFHFRIQMNYIQMKKEEKTS